MIADHHRGDRATAVKHRAQIGRDHLIPVLIGGICKELLHRDTGVIHQHVDLSEAILDLFDHSVDLGAVADVRLDGHHLTAGCHKLSAQQARFFFTVVIMDRNAILILREFFRARRADPAGRAGDQNRTHLRFPPCRRHKDQKERIEFQTTCEHIEDKYEF